MPRLLIAESFALLRPVLEKVLRDAGYQADCATSSREIVGALCDNEYDLLLIDLDMTMCDGLNTVRYVRRLKPGRLIKIIGLTNCRTREHIIECMKAGITTLLLKESCTPHSLVERVGQVLAATTPPPARAAARLAGSAMAGGSAAAAPLPATRSAPLEAAMHELPPIEAPEPLTLENVEAAIPRMLDGKALRPIVHQVIAMAGNPNADASTVAQVIRNDMEMSAKVIAAANSAFYRRRNVTVRNITDAINIIGLNGTRNLAMTLALVDHFCGNSTDPLLAMPSLFGHSISVAHLCERLAALTQICDPDQAFIVGLLHDLGRMLMAEHLASHYGPVVHANPAIDMNLHELERKVVGTDHALIGGIVTERWGCPSFISRAVRLHHAQSIQTEEGDDPLGGLLRLLLLADAMAIAFGFPGDQLEELPTIPRGWLGKTIKTQAEFREQVLDSLREAQAMIMSRSNLTIELPARWAGEIDQILMLGAVVQPLEPLQMLISHAYRDAKLISPGRADRGTTRTLVLADLRSIGHINDAASLLNWLVREKAPLPWPVLVVSQFNAEHVDQLGLNGRRVAFISPPLRPVLVRNAVESLIQGTNNPYAIAA